MKHKYEKEHREYLEAIIQIVTILIAYVLVFSLPVVAIMLLFK